MSYMDHVAKIDGVEPDLASVSTMIAKKIASPYKQHVTMMTVGRTGSGKSYAMLNLCEQLAIKLAKLLGGEPEDYFTIDNVAIITKEDLIRVVKSFKKYGIYLLDDIGVGWNARDYKKEGNIIMNDIIQTFRPNSNFLGMSLPDSFLIDKVPRSLVHYFMEMDTTYFEKEITIGKLFKVIRKPRTGDTYFEYPLNGAKYVRYSFGMPSLELRQEYDKRRDERYAELERTRMDRWTVINQEQVPKQSKKDLLFDTWASLREEGFSLREIGRLTHTDHAYVGNILKNKGVVV